MSRQCVAGVIWEAVYFNLPPGNQTSTRENNLTKLGCGQSFSSYVLNYIHNNTLPKAQGNQGFSFFLSKLLPEQTNQFSIFGQAAAKLLPSYQLLISCRKSCP